jgi:hypothetical protein
MAQIVSWELFKTGVAQMQLGFHAGPDSNFAPAGTGQRVRRMPNSMTTGPLAFAEPTKKPPNGRPFEVSQRRANQSRYRKASPGFENPIEI